MPAQVTTLPRIEPADDLSALVTGLRQCLAAADRLGLAMVGIHIEQACDWLIAQGYDTPDHDVSGHDGADILTVEPVFDAKSVVVVAAPRS